MTNETPTFLRRKQHPIQQAAASDVDVHPEVKAFLSRMRNDADAVNQMRLQLEEARLLIDKMDGRLTWATDELQRATRKRDEYQAGFAEQKIHFAVALTSALAAREQAIATVEACYEHAKVTNDGAYEQALQAVKGAYDPFVEAAHAAMKSIHQQMREAGVDPMDGKNAEAELGPDIDVVQIGKRFGADNRQEDDKPQSILP